jgi:hypothetical protein
VKTFTDFYDAKTTLEVYHRGSFSIRFQNQGAGVEYLLFRPEDRKALAEAIYGHEIVEDEHPGLAEWERELIAPTVTYSNSRYGTNMTATVEVHGGGYLSANPQSDPEKFRKQGEAYLRLARAIPELKKRYADKLAEQEKERAEAQKRADDAALQRRRRAVLSELGPGMILELTTDAMIRAIDRIIKLEEATADA